MFPDLGLEDIGLDFDPRGGVKVDQRGATNLPGVWAAGDVTGQAWLAHAASRMAEVVVHNITGQKDHMRHDTMPAVVYTSPEVAVVGLTKEEAVDRGFKVKTGKIPMAINARYIAENPGEEGMCKVVLDADTNRLLGVHMVGGACSEMIFGADCYVGNRIARRGNCRNCFPSSNHLRNYEGCLSWPSANFFIRTQHLFDMPKSQIVEPAEERKAGTIPFAEIPLNQYKQDIAKEKEAYGAEALVGMYEDMLLIRVFENMLQSIKTQGSYEGIEYDHKGPAHLSIGQEASSVGQAFSLGIDDHILGSHRSHGEILAKGMSAIRKLDDAFPDRNYGKFSWW